MLKKWVLVSVIAVSVNVTFGVLWANRTGEILIDVASKYVDSLEWSVDSNSALPELEKSTKELMKLLSSSAPDDQYYILVILGILERAEAMDYIKEISPVTKRVEIGRLFALCKLDKSLCSESLSKLQELGSVTVKAGSADSLRYPEVGQLLSFIDFADFERYINKLKVLTDEAYQKEALEISIRRHRLLNRNIR